MSINLNSDLGKQQLEKLYATIKEMNGNLGKTKENLKKFEENPTMENLSIALNENNDRVNIKV